MRNQFAILTLILFVAFAPESYSQQLHPPVLPQFITEDIDRFFAAFEVFKKDTASNPFISYLQEGTPGLQFLRQYAIPDSAAFKNVILKNVSAYDSASNYTKAMNGLEPQVSNFFQALKELYPEAVMPKFYFVIGAANVGGTTHDHGVTIGIEKFRRGEKEELERLRFIPIENLPAMLAVTMVYYNQKPAHTGYTVLRQSILQGSAEFIASLILGEERKSITQKRSFAYGQQYEELIAQEFFREKDSNDFSRWLYNRDSQERPGDLGHWVGFKIAEAYYDNAPDKKKAIDNMFKINDFEKFAVLSGYLEQFRK